MRNLTVLGLMSMLATGCAGEHVDVRTAEDVPIDLDRRNAERVARYYLGGLVGPRGGDPVAAGMLSVDGGALVLHPQALPERARGALEDDGDGVLRADEFSAWAATTYREARDLPATLQALRGAMPAWAVADTSWFSFEVRGSPMTHADRRLFVPVASLRAAIARFAAGGELRYPAGTLLVGEHLLDGELTETTVKRRRADGFWDFMVYGRDGRLVDTTSTPPRALRAPLQCTGCHLGSRQFEPDRSFPADAPAGPAGPRAVVVPPAWRDAGTAAIFREHAARRDDVLGIYATVYVGRLRAERAAGRPLPPADVRLLEALESRRED